MKKLLHNTVDFGCTWTRFRFCGDLDCPDWVLAEISTLAKLYDKVAKLTADAKFESGDIKASVAVLSFILSSAAKHDVDSESLSSELQQLGLPKVGRLDAVSWRIDYTLSSSELREVNEPVIQLKLQTQGAVPGPTETTVVSVSADKFRVLLAELKQAQAMMNALQ
ncbi:COMM domain-containing protein 4 [Collichthys lucidus]|uniref:COMM domain-containing protein 4 n=1 Tax=Collichthys lucidus TaxID=240159 RepID=A0A4U5UG43_COLLU|nr:COMM domain-containing protein 4 [Collichthys lucidus]